MTALVFWFDLLFFKSFVPIIAQDTQKSVLPRPDSDYSYGFGQKRQNMSLLSVSLVNFCFEIDPVLTPNNKNSNIIACSSGLETYRLIGKKTCNIFHTSNIFKSIFQVKFSVIEHNIPTHVCMQEKTTTIDPNNYLPHFFSIKPIHGIRHIPKQALDMYNYVTPKQLLREFDYRSNQSTIFVNTYMNFFHICREHSYLS